MSSVSVSPTTPRATGRPGRVVRRLLALSAMLTVTALTAAPATSQPDWEFTGPVEPTTRDVMDAAIVSAAEQLLSHPVVQVRETVSFGTSFGDILGYSAWTEWHADGSVFRAEITPTDEDRTVTELTLFVVQDGYIYAAQAPDGVWQLFDGPGVEFAEPPALVPVSLLADHELISPPFGAAPVSEYTAHTQGTSDNGKVWFLRAPSEPFEVRTFAVAPEGHLRMFTIKYRSDQLAVYGVGTDLPSGIEIRFFVPSSPRPVPRVAEGEPLDVSLFDLPPDFQP